MTVYPTSNSSTSNIVTQSDLEWPIFEEIAREVRNFLESDICLIWRLNRRKHRLEVVAWAGDLDETYRQTVFMDASNEYLTEFFKGKKNLFIKDVTDPSKASKYQHRQEAAERGWTSLLSVPLVYQDRVIGLIDNYTCDLYTFRDGNHRKLILKSLTVIGGQAASAIRNTYLSEESTTLQEINQILASTFAEETLLKHILSKGLYLVGSEVGWLYLLDRNNNTLQLKEYVGPTTSQPKPRINLGEGVTGWVAQTGDTLNVPDVNQDERHQPTPGLSVLSEVAVPLQQQGETIGVLNAKSLFKDTFTKDDITLLTTFAAQATTVIGRAKLTKHIEQVSHLALVSQTTNLQALADYVVEAVHDLIGVAVDLRLITESNETSYTLKNQACKGEFKASYLAPIEIPLDPSQSVATYALKYEQPVVRNNLHNNEGIPKFYYYQAALSHNWQSFMAVPLISSDKTPLGVLSLYSTKPHHFGDHEVELVSAFANQVAIVMHSLKLYQAQERQTKELEAIHQNALDILTQEELTAVLDTILQAAVSLLQGKGGVLYQADPHRAILNLVATLGIEVDIIGEALAYGEGMAGQVIQTREPMIVDNYLKWSGHIPRLAHLFTAVIEVPLMVGTEAIGVLVVFDDVQERRFSTSDIPSLTRLGQQAALALRHAQLLANERTLRRESETLREVTEVLVSDLDLEKVGRRILIELKKVIDYDKATIQLIHGDERALAAHAGFSPDEVDDYLLRPISEDRLVRRILSGRTIYIVPDTRYEPDWDIRVNTANVKSWIGVPIIFGEEPIGFLTLDHLKQNYYQRSTSQQLAPFATQAAIAIQNARLHNHTKRHLEEMKMINEVVQIMGRHLNTEHLLKTVVTEVANTLNCQHCVFFSKEVEDNQVWLVAKEAYGQDTDQLMRRRFKSGDGLVGWAYKYGESVMLGDAKKDPRFAPATIETNRPRSLLVVPVQIGEQTIGVISADQEKLHWFTQEDRRLVDTLARPVAIAIQRAMSLDILQKISRQIIRATDIDEILRLILEGAIKLSNAILGRIYLLTEDGQTIIKELHFPENFHFPSPRVPQKEGIVYEVSKTAEMIVIPNVKSDGRVNPATKQYSESKIAVPLKNETQVIGVLILDDVRPRQFSETEKSLLTTLAGQAAIALQQTTLFLKNQHSLDLLDALHETSLDIVKQLDINELMPLLLERAITLMGGELAHRMGAAYWHCDYAQGHAIIKYSTNQDFVDMKVGLNESLIGEVVRTKKTQYRNNFHRWPEHACIFDQTKKIDLIKNVIEAPLLEDGRVIAILAITEVSGERKFNETDIVFFERFANLATIALQNANLLEQERTLRRQAETLHLITQATTSGISVKECVAIIVQEAMQLINADGGLIHLINETNLSLDYSYPYPPNFEYGPSRFAERQGLVWEIYNTGELIEISDIHRSNLTSLSLRQSKVQSIIGLPLKVAGKVTAVLFICNLEPREFTVVERETLALIAEQAALVMDRIRRYEQRVLDISALEVINQAILQEDLTEINHLIVRKVMDLTNASYCVLRFVDQSGQYLNLVAIEGNPRKKETRIPIDDSTLNGHVAQTGEAWICSDVSQNQYYANYNPDAKSCMCVPLKRKDQIIGTMYVESEQAFAFSEPYQLNLFQALANQAVIAIQNNQMYQDRLRDITALQEINQAVISQNSGEVLDLIVQKATAVMPGEYGTLWLLEATTGDLILEAVCDPTNQVTKKINRIKATKKSISLRVAQTGRPYICYNVELEPEFYRLYKVAQSSISVPLKYQNEVQGVLNIESSHLAAFNKKHVELLEHFAGQAAIAIQNARLLEKEVKRATQLKALQEIAVTISSKLSLTAVLETIADNVNDILHANFSTIFAYDASEDKFSPGIRRGEIQDKPSMPGKNADVRRIVQTKEPFFVDDCDYINFDQKFYKQKMVKSFVGVPLIFGSEAVGVIYVNFFEQHSFSDEQQEIIRLLANQAAVAIANAHLYTAMEQEVEDRTRDLLATQEKFNAIQQLTVMERLAGEYAHRINNVAGTIPVRVALIKEVLEDADFSKVRLIPHLNHISEEVIDLLKMARTLKRSQVNKPEWVDVNKLLDAAIDRAWLSFPVLLEWVELEKNLQANLPQLYIDRTGLWETFISIIRNGVEAMPDGGILQVTTRQGILKNTPCIDIIIADTGEGITSDKHEKIFEALESSKTGGLGFGLWRDRVFIKGLGGDILLESELGEGATFIIKIPLETKGLEQ